MDGKYQENLELLVAELLSVYTKYLKKTTDEYEYVSVVLAALVFKELAEFEYRETIERDSIDDPDDICKLMKEKASELAFSLKSRSIAKTMN